MEKQNEVAEQEVEILASTEKVLNAVTDLVIVYKKVKLDGKFDANDSVYIVPALSNIPKYLQIDFKGSVAELKAFNLDKGLALLSLVSEAAKKIKAVK